MFHGVYDTLTETKTVKIKSTSTYVHYVPSSPRFVYWFEHDVCEGEGRMIIVHRINNYQAFWSFRTSRDSRHRPVKTDTWLTMNPQANEWWQRYTQTLIESYQFPLKFFSMEASIGTCCDTLLQGWHGARIYRGMLLDHPKAAHSPKYGGIVRHQS